MLMILKLLLMGSVFLVVFSLALRASRTDALYMFTHPGAALRAFTAMYIVVPVVAVLIALAFDIPPPVKVALVAMALSPMPPILPGKQMRAGGHFDYATGLLFGSAVVSIIAAPLGLWLIDPLVPADISLQPIKILPPILMTIGLPLLLGLTGRRLLGDARADSWSGPISRIGNIVLMVVAVILIVLLAPAMWKVVHDGALIALSAMILAGIGAGYLLAERGQGDKAALALAASARHPGVAIAIAVTVFPDEKLAPAAILLGTLLNVIISMLLMKRLGLAKSGAAG